MNLISNPLQKVQEMLMYFWIKVLSNMRNFPVYYILLNFPLLFFSYFSLEVAQWLIFLNLPDIELWHHRCSLCIGICGSVAFSTDVYYWDMRRRKSLICPSRELNPALPRGMLASCHWATTLVIWCKKFFCIYSVLYMINKWKKRWNSHKGH